MYLIQNVICFRYTEFFLVIRCHQNSAHSWTQLLLPCGLLRQNADLTNSGHDKIVSYLSFGLWCNVIRLLEVLPFSGFSHKPCTHEPAVLLLTFEPKSVHVSARVALRRDSPSEARGLGLATLGMQTKHSSASRHGKGIGYQLWLGTLSLCSILKRAFSILRMFCCNGKPKITIAL